MRFTLTLVIIIFGHTALASTEVFFSPADSAKKRLVTAIHAAENSLDIATFQFTSVDVAEALVEAKNRGTRIRILADENESQKEQSILPFLQEEGLNVKYIKGRFGGGMHHSFVIADSKAVFTGSYNLTEYSDKFNFENAIFTDEPRLVTKYQTQFDKLYGEPLAKIPSPATETAVTEKEPKHFIGLSISHLGKILGEDSMLSDSDKKMMWGACRNQYVRGKGEIVSSSVDPQTGPTVVIRDEGGVQIEILLDANASDKISKTSSGEVVNYTGRLLAHPETAHSSFKLDRGGLN